jgi:hypothetical protein
VSPERKVWFPEALQWKSLRTVHQLYHLGIDNSLVLVNKMFGGSKLRDTAQQIVQGCEMCQTNNPNNKQLMPGAQRQGSYPGEDWQLDFTHMPGGPKSKLLLALVDTFTGWVEAFLSEWNVVGKRSEF